MPRVPGNPAPVSAPAFSPPPPEAYLMAAAELHQTGALKALTQPPPEPKAK